MRALGASRTSVVPGGVLAGPWVRNELWRRARAVPSLDLRFADDKSLTDAVTGQSLITFTRASSATFIDSAGTLQTAATDVPRFDHNPTTGESLGLLVEEARTNSIRNNTGVGAVAGTPGTLPTNWATSTLVSGISREIVGTGTENGIAYIDIRVYGTPGSNGAYSIQPESTGTVSAATGQAWTLSSWIRIVGGSLANISSPTFYFDERFGAVFVTGGEVSVSYLSSAQQRYSATRTLSGGVTISTLNAGVRFAMTNGAAIDITLRIGLPQLEQGAFATSVIPTTGTAATRSADVASITGANFSSWYRQDEGTVFAESAAPSLNCNIVGISDGTGSNRVLLDTGTNTKRLTVTVGGVAQASLNRNYTYGVVTKNAAAVKQDSFQLCEAGSLATEDTSGTMPAVDRLNIGSSATAQLPLNGTIRRLCYWNQRLPNSTLQAITQ
jgi:hypothetical protein